VRVTAYNKHNEHKLYATPSSSSSSSFQFNSPQFQHHLLPSFSPFFTANQELQDLHKQTSTTTPFPEEGFDLYHSSDLNGKSVYESARASNSSKSLLKDDDNMDIENDVDDNDNPIPIDAPIPTLRDKWRLLPHFLKLRGLMRQVREGLMENLVMKQKTVNKRLTNHALFPFPFPSPFPFPIPL
jgi:hypothetical protein